MSIDSYEDLIGRDERDGCHDDVTFVTPIGAPVTVIENRADDYWLLACVRI